MTKTKKKTMGRKTDERNMRARVVDENRLIRSKGG